MRTLMIFVLAALMAACEIPIKDVLGEEGPLQEEPSPETPEEETPEEENPDPEDGSNQEQEEPEQEEPEPSAPPLSPGQIQGAGHRSPYENEYVPAVEGKVTLIGEKGFWIQADGEDPRRSRGLFVEAEGEKNLLPGDRLLLSGEVKEAGYEGELTLTVLEADSWEIRESRTDLPQGTPLFSGDAPEPEAPLWSGDDFDPTADVIDYLESREGMVIILESPVVAGGAKGGYLPLATPWPDAPLQLELAGSADPLAAAARGDRLEGLVTGVLSYRWGEYVLKPMEEASLESRASGGETTSLGFDENRLTLASFNVENFHRSDEERGDALAGLMASNMGAPDIIGLQEVTDDDGEADGGVVSGRENFSALSDRLEALTGKPYLFCSLDPADGEDGGLPGANIRTGFLYNPDRVSLMKEPEKLCPQAFEACRKPLLASFLFKGRQIDIVNVHLVSRRRDSPLMGEMQPPLLSSEEDRIAQASALRAALDGRYEEGIIQIILGDFNDYPGSPVLEICKASEGAPLKNSADSLEGEDRFTYVYKGRARQMDHILVPVGASAEAEILHGHSGSPEEGRASDHDPVLVSLAVPPGLVPQRAEGGVFFCDYGEGSGYNKYLEVANLSGETLEEGEYMIIYCSNGKNPLEGKIYPLPSLTDGALYMLCNSRSNGDILASGAETGGPSFNGNDQLLLVRDDNRNGRYDPDTDLTDDLIGLIGSDEDFAKDTGLTRQPYVREGSPLFDPEEWMPYPPERVDSGEALGIHRAGGDVLTP